jgi:hypothetical protein
MLNKRNKRRTADWSSPNGNLKSTADVQPERKKVCLSEGFTPERTGRFRPTPANG